MQNNTDLERIDAAIYFWTQAFVAAPEENERDEYDRAVCEHMAATIEALRVYKALLGEPSDVMLDEVPYSNTDALNPVEYNDFISEAFKAMSAELIKQVKEQK